ncbi:MAG: tetratricopeptide repeat protein [Gammaproteobacteria bacterium]|nr:tetratricopeptide repeat protein [Gammaproteobacteria bacterium]MBU1646677.1 tetratricopeptide repeat protein [Gammaproteobacteria bacterium]MBU1971710.1 tetratricopeptide repeat protein [Gammaproteobacteria bacterium]
MPLRFDRLLLVAPGWLAFMLYLPALSHGFVWDDHYFLIDLPYLRDSELWWRQLFEPLFVSRNYFRPLPLASFVMEMRLAGPDPFVFHLTNLLLHAANTTLVVLLVRAAIPGGALAAVGAGLLFAVHPALVENVAWISDRFDLMVALFVLLALVGERRLSGAFARAAWVGTTFLLALLCKESAVVLLALVPLWQAMRHWTDAEWRPWRRDAWTRGDIAVWAGLLLALCAYLLVRYVALEGIYRNDSEMLRGGFLQHMLLIGKTVGWYASLALWPFGRMLPVHPATTPVALGDAWAWLGLTGLLAGAVALGWALLWRPAARRPALAVAMALAALAPVANLVPLTIGDNLVHDRYLILSVAFLVLALALLWENGSRRRLGAATAGAWALAAVVTVAGLLPHWQSNLTLWRWAYEAEPASRIARESYVAALVNGQRFEETVAIARVILADTPDIPSTTHNLALALAQLGQDGEGEHLARRAIRQYLDLYDKDEVRRRDDSKGRLDISESYNLLGYLLLRQGRLDEAERALRQSIALTPFLTRPHYNLALLRYERGDWAGGDAELAFAERYGAPDLAAAHRRAGNERKRALQNAAQS